MNKVMSPDCQEVAGYTSGCITKYTVLSKFAYITERYILQRRMKNLITLACVML